MFESNLLPRGVGPFSTQTSFPKLLQQQISLTPPTFSLPLYMINPFNSNNDQFLFRKNYQLISRHQPSPSPALSTHHDDNLRSLQYRNPFAANPISISFRNSSVTSPQRPTSLTKPVLNSPSTRFGTKTGLLESADGWKRQIENRERQKLQAYGAEGLRYNAYLPEGRIRQQENEYYKIQQPHRQIKSPNFSNHQKNSANQHLNIYYQSPRNNILPQKAKPMEHFEDSVFESPNFNVIDPRKRDSRSNSSRNSKLNDMFDSDLDDKCKRSMQYNSYYGGGGTLQDEMIESKRGNIQGSRFQESGSRYRDSGNLPRSMSMESQIQKLDIFVPSTISLHGCLYYRIPL